MTTHVFHLVGSENQHPDMPVQRAGLIVHQPGQPTEAYLSAHARRVRRIRRLLARQCEIRQWQEKRLAQCEVDMNTVFLLLAEFSIPMILLAVVSEKYFGVTVAPAEKNALPGELPIATFRAPESQKAPWMIHVQNLADHIDQQQKKGQELFEKMKNRITANVH